MTEPIEVRANGSRGPRVIVVHGGPGAPGSAGALARCLSDEFRVLEPLQRRSGSAPLSVERHCADLMSIMSGPAAIVGWSWGAMLSLSFASRHPALVRSIALVGCGTYDATSRDEYHRLMGERLGADGLDEYLLQRRSTSDDDAERDARLAARGRLAARAQAVDPIVDDEPELRVDARGAEETWTDAMRLQAESIEPASFEEIRAPVLMLHGDADPHPGRATYEVLRRHIRRLDFVELAHCGHTPWLERTARGPFLDLLRRWLRSNA